MRLQQQAQLEYFAKALRRGNGRGAVADQVGLDDQALGFKADQRSAYRRL